MPVTHGVTSSSLVRTAQSLLIGDFKLQMSHGALVQLVRIHACHAWGHEFESRTHRSPQPQVFKDLWLFVFYFLPEIGHCSILPHCLTLKKKKGIPKSWVYPLVFQCVSLFAAATVVSSGNAIVIIVLARNCRNRDGAKYYCTKEKLEILVHNLNDFINKTYMWVIDLSVSPRSESG